MLLHTLVKRIHCSANADFDVYLDFTVQQLCSFTLHEACSLHDYTLRVHHGQRQHESKIAHSANSLEFNKNHASTMTLLVLCVLAIAIPPTLYPAENKYRSASSLEPDRVRV
jgi:hypothetical protein